MQTKGGLKIRGVKREREWSAVCLLQPLPLL